MIRIAIPRPLPVPEPHVCCGTCGGANVSYAAWYYPNTGATGDLFGSWNAGDNSFCDDCEECCDLVDRYADPQRFASLREMYRERQALEQGCDDA